MAGITTPFTTPTFPFLQTVSQRTLDNITPAFVLRQRAERRADCADADRGPRPGRVLRRPRTSDPATCSSGTCRSSASSRRTSPLEVAYVGSKITHVGIPDTNLNQLTVDQLALGIAADCSACRIRTSASSRARRRSAIRRSPWRSCSSRIPQYTTVSLYRNNVGTTLYQGLSAQAAAAALARPVVSRRLHALEAHGRCLVGVRRVDPDRTDRELPGGRQLQPDARARLLDRRHPARLRVVGRLGSAVRRGPCASESGGAQAARERLDARPAS